MSGYIIHFDNETELAHYGVKGMKWGKHRRPKTPVELRKEEIDNTPGIDEHTKRIRKWAVDYNYKEDKKAQQKYGLIREDDNGNGFSSSRFIGKHKSAKRPLHTKKYNQGQRNLATLAEEKAEKQLVKNLDSGKKMNKTYNVGLGSKIYFDQDSKGTFTYGTSPRAKRVINRSFNKHINNVESRRPINRGKKMVKSLFNKVKKLF